MPGQTNTDTTTTNSAGGDSSTLQRATSEHLELELKRTSLNNLDVTCRKTFATQGPFKFELETQYTQTRRNGPLMTKTTENDAHTFSVKVRHNFAYYLIARVKINGLTVAEKSGYYNTLEHRFGNPPKPAILNISEMKYLHQQAVMHTLNQHRTTAEVNVLYRNGPMQYFKNIFANNNGVMKVAPKNPNGNKRSPIGNGEISGMDFNCGMQGYLPSTSPFGEIRVIVPIRQLIQPLTHNLYFGDFYCHKWRHHVTLVVTKLGSEVDKYCRKHLIQLSMKGGKRSYNPFFFFSQGKFYTTFAVWVELYLTEDVRIHTAQLQNTLSLRTVGYGKPKREGCDVCSLAPGCKTTRCKYCSKFSKNDTVTSPADNTSHDCHTLSSTCQSRNLIYMIQCNVCGKQYVGETERRLSERLAEHFNDTKRNNNTSLAQHMNNCWRLQNNNNDDDVPVTVDVLEKIPEYVYQTAAAERRKEKERHWIETLETLAPNGINQRL